MSITGDAQLFPILGGYSREDVRSIYKWEKLPQKSTIPWWLAEIAYVEYSRRYGCSQSLERIAERGGFGREELLALLSPAAKKAYERILI